MSRVRPDPALVVVLAGMAAALHVAKLPPAVPVLQQALGLDLVSAGFLLSLVQLAGMTLGLLVGLSVDAVGLRRSMLAGLGLLSLASAWGGWSDSVTMLMVLRAVEGFGFLWVVMPAPALIRRAVAAAHLQTRMGLWAAYMPSGTALALLLGPLVMMAWGWQVWWWALAWATGVGAVAVWRWVPDAPPAVRETTLAPMARSDMARRLRLTLCSAGPWWVSLSFAVYSSQWLAVIGFLPTIYTEMGLSAALTGVLTASVALANVAGNVWAGRLLQRGWPARRLLHIGFACMAVGALGAFVALDAADPAWPVAGRYLSVVGFSTLGGLIPGTLFSMAVRLAPDESTVSTTVGYMQQWSAFGQFAGPPVVAWVAASVGGWQWTGAVTGTLCVAGAWLATRIDRAVQIRAHHD